MFRDEHGWFWVMLFGDGVVHKKVVIINLTIY